MKLTNKTYIVSACLALLLSACGTTNNQSAEPSQETQNQNLSESVTKDDQTSEPATEQEQANASQTEEAEESKSPDSTQSAEETQEESVQDTPDEASIEQSSDSISNQEAQLENSAFVKSDNQDYEIAVLNGYGLEAEEPGRDVVVEKGNEQNFMRIEIISDHLSKEQAEEIVKQTATAIDVNAVKYEGAENHGLPQDTVWYKSYAGQDAVQTILVNGNRVMKLSIYTPKDREEENVEKFLTMAKTIK